MPEASPRLFATDLDGTLLRDDGSISARTRAAIAAAEASGVPVLFVTARPPRWLDGLADAVGRHGYAICGNGAFGYDVARRRVVDRHTIPADELNELVADLRAAVPGIAFAAEYADGMAREAAYVSAHPEPPRTPVGPIETVRGEPVGKLLGIHPERDPTALLAAVAEVVAERAEIAFSGAVGLAEITARGVTKASALTAWCARGGIAREDVWAVGDMPNDLPMLRWAGRGFAVANAHPGVIAVADETCASNEDDGVAEVLEQLVSRAEVRSPDD